jgi:rhodanese-related sulfurtransferase
MVHKLDGETLKRWVDAGERMVILDGRAEEDYAVSHLPGAISLLNTDVQEKAEVMIPKGVKVVVYSNDADCPASGLVAGKLDKMSFGPVYDYNDSYKDWVSRGYPLETLS